MAELDFESDQFLELLTDALRAGPGSPEWHRAVTALRSETGSTNIAQNQAREYELLITARQHLESGRDYRGISAGDGFTRRVMDAVEREPDSGEPPRLTTSGIITALSALLIIIAAIVVGYLIFRSQAASNDSAIDALGNTYFANTWLNVTFDGPLSDEWQHIGSLPIDSMRGLRLSARSEPSSQQVGAGGGVYWTRALPADGRFEVHAALTATRGVENVIAQLFVTDDPSFSGDRGTSARELVYLLQAEQSKVVLPDGRVQTQANVARQNIGGAINLRLLLDRSVAVVEQSGQHIWSGAHGLADDKPRYIGLRFLRMGQPARKEPPVAFISVKVQAP